MGDDAATIAELRAEIAGEQRKRVAAEKRQTCGRREAIYGGGSLDVATRRTTLKEYLKLYHRLVLTEVR